MQLKVSWLNHQSQGPAMDRPVGESQQRISCHLYSQEVCLVYKVKASQNKRDWHSSTHKILLLTEHDIAKKEKENEN